MKVLILLLNPGLLFANSALDFALTAKSQAMQAMQVFNPQDLSRTTSNLQQEDIAKFVINEEQHRVKVKPNPIEIATYDRLLEKLEIQTPIADCADGQCDLSKSDVSDDLNEGLSRLGAVAATAAAVEPFIFQGVMQECEKYMLGMRDCCVDDGFLDGIIHCPHALQILQQAKSEHRVAYVGHYKPHRFSTTRYRFCVFPTKLAGIVQLQGRYTQLGIGFGSVWHPDCRGVTPDELSRINFKALDLHEMVAEFVGKKTIPQDADFNVMYEKVRAYD